MDTDEQWVHSIFFTPTAHLISKRERPRYDETDK